MTFNQIKNLGSDEQSSALQETFAEAAARLIDNEDVAARTAETNAFGWMLDELTVDERSITVGPDCIEADVNLQFCGDQDLDMPACGDVIEGTATARLCSDETVVFENIEVEIRDWT